MDKPLTQTFVDVTLRLRSPQAAFLEFLANKHEVDESKIVRRLIVKRINEDQAPVLADNAVKRRKHLVLGLRHIAYLDKLCRRYGLSRSDVVRRLIDDAREEHQNADLALRNVA